MGALANKLHKKLRDPIMADDVHKTSLGVCSDICHCYILLHNQSVF